MGCTASKTAVTPVVDSSGILRESHRSEGISVTSLQQRAGSGDREKKGEGDRSESGKPGKVSSSGSQSLRLGNLHRYIEGEQVAAGWPNWLSSVAREAIHGWVPLKADSFEKLDKIGQGTYSSVFRARDLDTGKIVALKKVRFDNFEPESVRFMAREIQILRRLRHPNIVNLEGLIASRLSCSIYLVFEYMEHDLAGLSSCPDIKFSESQIKYYMNQLLSGLEHCHSHGIIHRDIKGANLLVNNDGILKIADFGLANFSNPVNKQPLTSRVVTLWYRPPELLLGSTDYEATVDLWSVGCVFAEMFLGKPILQGRTEVEQLHKIFKMCGSPTDEYWKKSKLPHATIFKPHHPYESCLRETFKCLHGSAFNLLETFLSVEPDKRGTASSSLASEYFRTKPYACEPSSLPKYPPNKEIDARSREQSCRKRAIGRVRGSQAARRPSGTYRISRERSGLHKLATHQEEPRKNTNGVHKPDGKLHLLSSVDGDVRLLVDLQPVAAINPRDEGRRLIQSSHRDIPFSGPLNTAVKKLKEDLPYVVSHYRPSAVTHCSDLKCPNSFDYSDKYHYMGDTMSFKHGDLGYQDEGDKVEFSGPLLPQSHKVNEFLQKHEHQVRQAIRRSWFQRVAGKRQGK